jgi:hypothetical protein
VSGHENVSVNGKNICALHRSISASCALMLACSHATLTIRKFDVLYGAGLSFLSIIFRWLARSGWPITVAARSMAWTVFARSNTGIVGSNPTQGIDVCVCVYSVCVVLHVGKGLATGRSPVQGVLPTVQKWSRNWRRGQSPTKGCRAIDEWTNEHTKWFISQFTVNLAWKEQDSVGYASELISHHFTWLSIF